MTRIVALALVTSCAHVPTSDAVTAHNVYRRVLVEASDAFAPLYGAASAKSMAKGDADYEVALKPYNGVVRALDAGRHAEIAINVALTQCIAAGDEDCDIAKVGFACAVLALDDLWRSYGQIPGGVTFYAATAVTASQLRLLAGDAQCVVRP
jgi:hypothetical protein